MKRAIFSLNVGDNPDYFPCLRSQFEYAKRVGADYLVGREMQIKRYNFYFEKLQCLSLFENGYDQVLYMDADVLVTPNAEDIFEKHNDTGVFYAHHENEDTPAMDRDPYVENVLPQGKIWPKINGRYRYFNAGVMLFGSEVWEDMLKGIDTPPETRAIWEFGDQTFMNYLTVLNKTPFESLPREFNWMNRGESDEEKTRFNANFIHYAGPCLYGGSKAEVMNRDYTELYGHNADEFDGAE